MALAFYSPKKDGSGALIKFSVTGKEQSIFAEMVAQTGWDTTKKKGNGTFKGGAKLTIKFDPTEAGWLMWVVENKTAKSFFHSSETGSTQVNFTYYKVKDSDREGFGFKAKRGDIELKAGLDFGQAYRLREFLRMAIDRCHGAAIMEDKKRREEYKKQAEESDPLDKQDETDPFVEQESPEADPDLF